MFEIVVGALSGDPLYQQHLSWLLQRPLFWLVMTKFAIVLLGVVWIFCALSAARLWKAVGSFALILVGAGWVTFVLYQPTKLGFENGQGAGFAWRGIGLATDVFAIGVLITLWKRRRFLFAVRK